LQGKEVERAIERTGIFDRRLDGDAFGCNAKASSIPLIITVAFSLWRRIASSCARR
jgi:hypothetical protein